MFVVIREQRIRVEFVDGLIDHEGNECYGLCDPPDKRDRTVRISKATPPAMLLEVILHELLHAAFWDLSEVAVDTAAEDISRALMAMGVYIDSTPTNPTQ